MLVHNIIIDLIFALFSVVASVVEIDGENADFPVVSLLKPLTKKEVEKLTKAASQKGIKLSFDGLYILPEAIETAPEAIETAPETAPEAIETAPEAIETAPAPALAEKELYFFKSACRGCGNEIKFSHAKTGFNGQLKAKGNECKCGKTGTFYTLINSHPLNKVHPNHKGGKGTLELIG